MFGAETWATLFFMTAFYAYLKKDECDKLELTITTLKENDKYGTETIQKLRQEINQLKAELERAKENAKEH